MDRLEAMSMLLLVVEKGSFTAAAKSLRVPLPTLSRRIAELEAHLGARLLQRSTRKLVTTDAGAAYIDAARRIVEAVGEAERAAAGEFSAPRGELTLTAPVLFGQLHVLPIVEAFLALYGEIRVRLQLSDRNLHLIEDHVDVAVRIGALPDSGLQARKVGEMRTILCAAPSFLEANGRLQHPRDLSRLPTIGFDALSSAEWTLRDPTSGAPLSVTTAPRLRVSTAAAAVAAAAHGVGIARVLHYQAEAEIAADRLEIVLPAFEPAPSPVQLLHAGGPLPVKTRRFLDLAADRLRALLP